MSSISSKELSRIREKVQNGFLGVNFSIGTDSTTFSSFVIEKEEQWIGVTAGHCIDDTIKAIHLLGREKAMLHLYPATIKPTDFAIPFSVDEFICSAWVNDANGNDIGFFKIHPSIKRLLLQAGVVPLIAKWEQDFSTEKTDYFLLGVPYKTVTTRILDERYAQVLGTLYIAEIEQIIKPNVLKAKPGFGFYGRIFSESVIPDIKGMSGGPIIERKVLKNGDEVFSIIGAQSIWNKDSREIGSCLLMDFQKTLAEAIGM